MTRQRLKQRLRQKALHSPVSMSMRVAPPTSNDLSAAAVSTSDRREDRQAVVEASIGRPVVTILRKPLRYTLRQIDSSLQTLGRFFDLAAEAFVFRSI